MGSNCYVTRNSQNGYVATADSVVHSRKKLDEQTNIVQPSMKSRSRLAMAHGSRQGALRLNTVDAANDKDANDDTGKCFLCRSCLLKQS